MEVEISAEAKEKRLNSGVAITVVVLLYDTLNFHDDQFETINSTSATLRCR